VYLEDTVLQKSDIASSMDNRILTLQGHVVASNFWVIE